MKKISLSKIGACFQIERYSWYTYAKLLNQINEIDEMIIFNGALNYLESGFLFECRKQNHNIKISLYLIDSLMASSPMLLQVRDKINNYPWDTIYTFDPIDAKKNGFIYRGFDYYSAQNRNEILSQKTLTDLYFIGGLKGNRTEYIKEVFEYVYKKGGKCDFNLLPYSATEYEEAYEGINYIRGGWIPYADVLKGIAKSKCIFECLQKGQTGASLRYFEAICYNKKLISTNHYIKKFPFYNSKYMKIIDDVEEIDMEWLTNDLVVDYGYDNRFSPKNLKGHEGCKRIK